MWAEMRNLCFPLPFSRQQKIQQILSPAYPHLDQNNPSFHFRGSFLCITDKEIQTNPALRFHLELRHWNVFFWGRKAKCLTFPNYILADFIHQIQNEYFSQEEPSGGWGKEGFPLNLIFSLLRHLQSMLSLACLLSHKHCPCFVPLQSVPWKMRPMRTEQRPRWSATAVSVPAGTGCALQWRARVCMLSRKSLCLG